MRHATAVTLLVALLAVPHFANAASTRCFALTTDFSTGSLSVADLDTRAVSQDVASVGSDAVARWYQGLLYVVNRFGGDNVQVIDPAQGYATIRQFSVGNGSNPQDIAFVSPTKAYVSRYGSSDLLVVNPSSPTGGPMTPISLAAFADGDGLPEMARLFRYDRWLFVACQRLTNFQPSNPSLVVVVDTQADTVYDVNALVAGKQAITLTGRNPFTQFVFDPFDGHLWIGCAGAFGVNDGGVEAIDPVSFADLGFVATEATLGGDIGDVVWHRQQHSYAIVTDPTSSHLVTWNPSTGQKLGTPFTASGFSLPDMELNDRGELYLCRNTFSAQEPPGLMVLSSTTDAVVAGPLDTGLPPVAITFDQATDVADVPSVTSASVRLAAPWPNPASDRARFSFTLPRASDARIDVFDVTGRRVREIARGVYPAGTSEVQWDLRDDRDHAVDSGVYFVGLHVGGESSRRRIVIAR
jgi:hypothetical protein